MKPEDVNPDDYGREYFEDLLTQFDEHPDWKYSWEKNIAAKRDLVIEASNFHQQEVFIDHEETDATLHLTVPHAYEPVLAATGSMEQPLDGLQGNDPHEDSFGEEVQETYRSITEGYGAEYFVDREADPIHIIGIRVPLDYDRDTLYDTLNVASNVSRDIQQVNDEVMEVLEGHR